MVTEIQLFERTDTKASGMATEKDKLLARNCNFNLIFG